MFVKCNPYLWKYFLVDMLDKDIFHEVSEKEFLSVVSLDRKSVPMEYDKNNINRQNFISFGHIIGYRIRVKSSNMKG